MVHQGILTLPGTVGRGFYFPIGENGTWIFACYVNIRKLNQGFSSRETQRKTAKQFFGKAAKQLF